MKTRRNWRIARCPRNNRIPSRDLRHGLPPWSRLPSWHYPRACPTPGRSSPSSDVPSTATGRRNECDAAPSVEAPAWTGCSAATYLPECPPAAKLPHRYLGCAPESGGKAFLHAQTYCRTHLTAGDCRSDLPQQHIAAFQPACRQACGPRTSRPGSGVQSRRPDQRYLHRRTHAAAAARLSGKHHPLDGGGVRGGRRRDRTRRASDHRRQIRRVPRLDARLPHRRQRCHPRTFHGRSEEAGCRLRLHR